MNEKKYGNLGPKVLLDENGPNTTVAVRGVGIFILPPQKD